MNKTLLTINTLVLSIFYTASFAAQVTLESEFVATQQQSQQLALLVAAQADPDPMQAAAMELTTPSLAINYLQGTQKLTQKEKKEEANVKALCLPPIKKFDCTKCPISCATFAGLYKHIQRKHDHQHRYNCLCGKKFYDKSHFEEHEITHTNQKAFACAPCFLEFGKKFNFDRHQKSKAHLTTMANLYAAVPSKTLMVRQKPY